MTAGRAPVPDKPSVPWGVRSSGPQSGIGFHPKPAVYFVRIRQHADWRTGQDIRESLGICETIQWPPLRSCFSLGTYCSANRVCHTFIGAADPWN